MQELKEPQIKLFIYDMLMFDDNAGVDENGNRIMYKTFPKDLYKTYVSLKNRLQAHCDVLLYDESKVKEQLTDADLIIIPANEFVKDAKGNMIGRKFLYETFRRDDELLLDENDLKVIKYYYSLKKEIPITLTVENLEKFEGLLK